MILSENPSTIKSQKRRTRKAKPETDDNNLGGYCATMTDVGNGRRLVALHGAKMRYVHAWHKWLVWDEQRWSDTPVAAMRLAKETARHIYHEAATVAADNDKAAGQLARHATASHSIAKLTAMLTAAQSEPGIAIAPDKLDSQPWLLNVQNGTIDLRTGCIRPHATEDMLTRLSPVTFDEHADCPVWLAFLDRIFAGDVALVSFFQRLLGYCLTGETSEHVLPIAWGCGANGKSTLVNAFLDVLGTGYSMKATQDLLTPIKGQHPTERARLAGKRFVAAVETDDGRKLAESLVKELTGGDVISARFMHQDHFDFRPTHKILLATNHKPVIKGTDNGIWRRVRLIPFSVTVPKEEQDTRLPGKLHDELPGILAWCVRGARDWYGHGLGEPSEVAAATASYRDEQDTLGRFLADCCVLNPDARCGASDLYKRYAAWCESEGEPTKTQTTFGRAMAERGLENRKSHGTKSYTGIGILKGQGLGDS